jgi:hypothetical protein
MYRAASVPLVIFADQKVEYFDSLVSADAGNYRPFIDFILDRAVDTIRLVADQISGVAESQLTQLRDLLTSHGGLSHAEIDQIGYRVQALVLAELQSQASSLGLPPGVTVNVQTMQGGGPAAEGPDHRPLLSQGPQWIMLWGQVNPPAQAHAQYQIRLLTTRQQDARFAYRLGIDGKDEVFDFRLRDVDPQPTSAFNLRLAAWIRHILKNFLTELTAGADAALKASGYRHND